MNFHILLLLVFVNTMQFFPQRQGTGIQSSEITPLNGIVDSVELSPNGLYVGIMTRDAMGEPTIEVWDTAQTTRHIRLVPDLTIFIAFFWSPNSQYIAVTGHRGNASGTEYALLIYDILDIGYGEDLTFPDPGRSFKEFLEYEDTESGFTRTYSPVWSQDSHIIAGNFQDGIHFYDITDCNNEGCKLLYVLNIGFVSWFDWKGDKLIAFNTDSVQVYDLSQIVPNK